MQNKRRKQCNSHQRRQFIQNDSFKCDQHQYCIIFLMFEIVRFHGTTPCSTSVPPLQMRFAIWCGQSATTTMKNLRKIRLGETNSQISKNSMLYNPNILQRFARPTWPKHHGTCKALASYRSTGLVITRKANAASNEIRVSEEKSLKIIASDVISVNIS